MQLIFKRCKLFLDHPGSAGERRYIGNIGADGRAPAWIAETDTFKIGVKDGSIIDLKAKAEAEEAETQAKEEAAPTPPPVAVVPAGLAGPASRKGGK